MKNIKYFRKNLLLLCCSLVTVASVYAQDVIQYGANLYSPTAHNAGDTLTVFADTAYIRDQPGTNGKLVAPVPAGTKLVFLRDAGAAQTVKGFYTTWIQVRFIKNGVAGEGYLWKGLTALGAFRSGDHRFLYGIDRVAIKPGEDGGATLFVKLKAINTDNQTLSVKTWPLSSIESTSFSEGKLLGNMGLEGVSDIVRVHFSGEACGIPDDYFYFGWNGTELLALPGKSQVGDAGIFYHTETLLFPTEQGGKPGQIIKLIEEAESTEKMDKNGEPIMKKTNTRETFTWDGKKAVKI